ncbi:MAG: redoxin domain-containing protein [Dehalococcoidia bacterium]|nr:redoxin domain-containing protein [Dehalococcoidia bacterium]
MQSRIALCSVCHSQMSASQSYCNNCGSTLCPHCRELLPQRSRFCPKCGFLCVVEQPKPVNKPAPPTAPTMPPAMPIPRAAVAGGRPAARAAVHQQPVGNTVVQYHRNCPKCGASIDHELGRCSGCGLLYGGKPSVMQQPAAPAMPIPRPAASRPQSSARQQAPGAYNVVPQYNNPRHTPPPTGTGQHPNYAPTGVTPQGGMLMPIPRVAPATAGTMAPPGAPMPPRPYQYHAAPSATMERRAPVSGKGGLSGFATTIIVILVCLLVGGGIYYFINRTGTTPEVNNVVNTPILSKPDVSAQSITETSATIKWATNKPATGLVEVRDSNGAVIDTQPQTALVNEHSVTISGLSPNTKYYYTVTSTDSDGKEKTSEGDLTTLATATVTADKTPPSISGAAANTTESSAIVTWLTDESATGQVKYSKDGQNTSTTPEVTNLTTFHSITLSNLDSGTTYTFTIISKDAAGNEAASASNHTFTTVSSIPVAAKEGSRAPDFTLQDLNNNQVKLSDFRGKIVVVNFWATWCGPCMNELPFFQAISDNQSAGGFKILAINDKESKNKVNSELPVEGYTFTILLDPKGDVYQLYDIVPPKTIPQTFFIDKEGIIKKIKVDSFSSKKEIEDILNSLK